MFSYLYLLHAIRMQFSSQNYIENLFRIFEIYSIFVSKSLREKCPNTEISGPYVPVFEPEKTPYMDTFHAVNLYRD